MIVSQLSGWPSGLRRCVQVAVSPGGVGSNPTSDKACILLTLFQHTSRIEFVEKGVLINKHFSMLPIYI